MFRNWSSILMLADDRQLVGYLVGGRWVSGSVAAGWSVGKLVVAGSVVGGFNKALCSQTSVIRYFVFNICAFSIDSSNGNYFSNTRYLVFNLCTCGVVVSLFD